MQQRQPRLGDIVDDYCPRERRLTNHAVVAMIGDDIRLTRCTTCESEHDYKHARLPRLKKKDDAPLGHAIGVPAPRRVVHDDAPQALDASADAMADAGDPLDILPEAAVDPVVSADALFEADAAPVPDEGPVHRQLIRAQLPKHDGQVPSARQAPDFTIRQPGGGAGRFRPRAQRAGGLFFDRDGHSGGNNRGGGPRPSGRPAAFGGRGGNRQGGRKRSK